MAPKTPIVGAPVGGLVLASHSTNTAYSTNLMENSTNRTGTDGSPGTGTSSADSPVDGADRVAAVADGVDAESEISEIAKSDLESNEGLASANPSQRGSQVMQQQQQYQQQASMETAASHASHASVPDQLLASVAAAAGVAVPQVSPQPAYASVGLNSQYPESSTYQMQSMGSQQMMQQSMGMGSQMMPTADQMARMSMQPSPEASPEASPQQSPFGMQMQQGQVVSEAPRVYPVGFLRRYQHGMGIQPAVHQELLGPRMCDIKIPSELKLRPGGNPNAHHQDRYPTNPKQIAKELKRQQENWDRTLQWAGWDVATYGSMSYSGNGERLLST